MMRAAGLVLMIALGACRSDTPTIKLELAETKLAIDTAAGAKHTLTMNPGGVYTFDGQIVGAVTPTGKLLIGGAIMGNVDLDGTIRFDNKPTNAKVLPDGTFELDGGTELTLGPDGVASGVLLDTIDHPALGKDLTIRYEGPPGARRATMIGFAMIVTRQTVQLPPVAN
jgi:hypothetical protein